MYPIFYLLQEDNRFRIKGVVDMDQRSHTGWRGDRSVLQGASWIVFPLGIFELTIQGLGFGVKAE